MKGNETIVYFPDQDFANCLSQKTGFCSPLTDPTFFFFFLQNTLEIPRKAKCKNKQKIQKTKTKENPTHFQNRGPNFYYLETRDIQFF